MVESLDGKPGLTVTNVPSFDLYYLMMNCKHGPTADPKVRRAIAHGFNYDAFINGTL